MDHFGEACVQVCGQGVGKQSLMRRFLKPLKVVSLIRAKRFMY
jgi:hypothetical protein